MKKNILIQALGVVILFGTLQARSQNLPVDKVGENTNKIIFECSNQLNQLFVKALEPSPDGKDIIVEMVKDEQIVQSFTAVLVPQESLLQLYKVFNYDLFTEENKIGALKVMSHQLIGRGGCGRAACGENGFNTQVITSALLKLGENETSYNCN